MIRALRTWWLCTVLRVHAFDPVEDWDGTVLASCTLCDAVWGEAGPSLLDALWMWWQRRLDAGRRLTCELFGHTYEVWNSERRQPIGFRVCDRCAHFEEFLADPEERRDIGDLFSW